MAAVTSSQDAGVETGKVGVVSEAAWCRVSDGVIVFEMIN